MTTMELAERARRHLHTLCEDIDTRRVGSAGNRAATDFFAETCDSHGFHVQTPEFDCIDLAGTGATLAVGDTTFEVFPSPYSLGCDARSELTAASTAEELAGLACTGKLLLLHGEITAEQLMPKNFVFYNPESHQRIIGLLEQKRPAAIIAATGRNPELVGATYPYPLIEDGDFDIPSVYMTEVEGDRLLARAGQTARLTSDARRIPSRGCSVVAQRGNQQRRIVFCAHIDAKAGTPGALDDGSGTATLLLLAELLQQWEGDPGVEIVAYNGEDYYAVPGQMRYLADNRETLDRIALAVNLDDLGYHGGHTSFSFYQCPDETADTVRRTWRGHPELREGPQWFQGDHMIFAMNGRPAMAITTECLETVMRDYVHTDRDVPELVDCAKLAACAQALAEVMPSLA